MNIIAQQFPHTAISGFQPKGLVPYFDEHTQCWTEQFGRFQRQDPPSVQIHHTGGPFPQSTSSNTEVVKVYTRKIESICYCGKPDVFQNMVGCEAKRGRVKCSKWVHHSCSGVSGDWFCDEHL